MAELERALEGLVESLGFEVVTLDRGGGRRRPVLRLKIDRPWGEPGQSEVTVDDCTRLAREIRGWLEDREEAPEDWVLEVSSPGVERPLVRLRDYRRFAGEQVRLKGYGPLVEGSKVLEGELLGIADEDAGSVAIRVDGERFEVSVTSIASAHLVYDWDAEL